MDCNNEIKSAQFTGIMSILDRAAYLGIGKNSRLTQYLDVEAACIQYNMKLEDWLAAPVADFIHDFAGIQDNIDRRTGLIYHTFHPLFVPKFADSPLSLYPISPNL